MGKINQLDKSVYNRLSAGEVVENPASIVKELVENSIDAGARNITVMIENGGIKSVSVIDDGCGIEKEDLPLAIMPHATSKISEAEDLEMISTLGFRGEALASIAGVSRVEIKSKFIDSEIANYIIVQGGDILESGECPLAIGTAITVSSLFFNTPVRYKFLKPEKGEENNVTHVVYDLMLSNPDISIKYVIDGEIDAYTQGEGIEGVIAEIYGQELFDDLLHFELMEKNYTVKGYTARPASGAIQGNKNKQVFIVNGRIFEDSNLPAIIQNAYGERLMKRTFPAVVLDIVLPFDEVDVNVHPGKKEVRFAEKKLLNGLVYSAIKKAIEDDEEKRQDQLRFGSLFHNATRENIGPTVQKVLCAIDDGTKDVLSSDTSVYRVKQLMKENDVYASDLKPLGPKHVHAHNSYEELPDDYKQFEEGYYDEDAPIDEYVVPVNVTEQDMIDRLPAALAGIALRNPSEIPCKDENKYKIAYVDEEEKEQEIRTMKGIMEEGYSDSLFDDNEDFRRKYRIVGQVFDTYFIIESGKQLFFIDQHAAHERILYDKLLKEAEEYTRVQGFLLPYFKRMTEEEMQIFRDNEENLLCLGFEIKFRKNGVEICSVPHMLTDINLEEFVYSVLSMTTDIKKLNDIAKIKDRFAKIACRSAIKGGMRLTDEEVEYVMDFFFKNGMPLQCPHGRPTVIVLSQAEVEKWFKRIV